MPNKRCGLTAADVVVVVVIMVVTVLLLLMALPQGREHARLAACRRNLGQIGFALALFDQMEQKLPTIGDLAGVDQQGAGGLPARSGRSSPPWRSLTCPS